MVSFNLISSYRVKFHYSKFYYLYTVEQLFDIVERSLKILNIIRIFFSDHKYLLSFFQTLVKYNCHQDS